MERCKDCGNKYTLITELLKSRSYEETVKDIHFLSKRLYYIIGESHPDLVKGEIKPFNTDTKVTWLLVLRDINGPCGIVKSMTEQELKETNTYYVCSICNTTKTYNDFVNVARRVIGIRNKDIVCEFMNTDSASRVLDLEIDELTRACIKRKRCGNITWYYIDELLEDIDSERPVIGFYPDGNKIAEVSRLPLVELVSNSNKEYVKYACDGLINTCDRGNIWFYKDEFTEEKLKEKLEEISNENM